jgi:NAD+ diphosphatase
VTPSRRGVGQVEGAPLPALALSGSDLDRAGERRGDAGWLQAVWQDAETRVLVVSNGRVALAPGSGGAPAVRWYEPAQAPEGRRYLLGIAPGGTIRCAVGCEDLPLTDGVPVPSASLRELAFDLDESLGGTVAHAVALDNWHRTHTHCPRCGAPTELAAAGHVRRCTADGTEHYPRTDPAVIMSVVDDDERILLGRHSSWAEGRFSTLAGFVEPGESLERAVAREVWEEVGIRISSAHYLGSQPWPFPSSLMLGFLARAETTAITIDGEEIAQARWFSRNQLRTAVQDGEVVISPSVSISRRLIEHWNGAVLDDQSVGWR